MHEFDLKFRIGITPYGHVQIRCENQHLFRSLVCEEIVHCDELDCDLPAPYLLLIIVLEKLDDFIIGWRVGDVPSSIPLRPCLYFDGLGFEKIWNRIKIFLQNSTAELELE